MAQKLATKSIDDDLDLADLRRTLRRYQYDPAFKKEEYQVARIHYVTKSKRISLQGLGRLIQCSYTVLDGLRNGELNIIPRENFRNRLRWGMSLIEQGLRWTTDDSGALVAVMPDGSPPPPLPLHLHKPEETEKMKQARERSRQRRNRTIAKRRAERERSKDGVL